MLIFISGSINSGKTTIARMLAKKLGAEFLNFDDSNDTIPNFDLAKDIPKTYDLGIKKINGLTAKGKDVVANYVVRTEDWVRLLNELEVEERCFITLAPRLEIAQSNRGDRQLSDWEVERIKYHYDTGIVNPPVGKVIDNSDLSAEETVGRIVQLIQARD